MVGEQLGGCAQPQSVSNSKADLDGKVTELERNQKETPDPLLPTSWVSSLMLRTK